MSITTLYHVSVDVPHDVYEAYGDTWEYKHAVHKAILGFIEAGTNTYDWDAEEWATFISRRVAGVCQEELQGLVRDLTKRLAQEKKNEDQDD